MSGKLDQSLDEILSTRKPGAARGRPRRRGAGTRAVVGGVQKSTAKPATKTAAKGTADKAAGGATKIIVSGLVSLHPPSISSDGPWLTVSSLPT